MQQLLNFRGQVNALVGETGCLGALETTTPIRLGWPESNVVASKAEVLANEALAHGTCWCLRLRTMPILNRTIAAGGSPSEGWSFLKEFYAPPMFSAAVWGA